MINDDFYGNDDFFIRMIQMVIVSSVYRLKIRVKKYRTISNHTIISILIVT
jgi:hypothetical protein